MNGYDGVLLDTRNGWRGEGPGDHCFKKSTRFHELENIYFVGHIQHRPLHHSISAD